MAARGCFHSALAYGRQLAGSSTDCVRHSVVVPTTNTQNRLLLKRSLSPRESSIRGMASGPVADARIANGLTVLQRTSKYEEAIVALNSLQSNAETIRKSLANRNEARKQNIPQMINFLHRVGLSLDAVDNLSVIHITGTKGKGSTCAFAESILRHYGYKTGFFSSPHLIEARERIRINGSPVDRDTFSSCFWEVYEKLLKTKEQNEGIMPHYFSFLTTMAFHIFVLEKVDVVLLEVGIGGQYDSTNVVRRPVVCGISSLDLDHTNLLGSTLEEIAWHKAGIFKAGITGITVPQTDLALDVILKRSQEIGCPLYVAEPLTAEDLMAYKLTLGIAGDRQVYNAGLAVHLCQVWLNSRNPGLGGQIYHLKNQPQVTSISSIPRLNKHQLTREMITGLSQCSWPGRNQTVRKPGVTYYLDGAHTTDSMQQCVRWFLQAADTEKEVVGGKVYRSLVFNMTGDRPVSTLLEYLKGCGFNSAAFCPNILSTTASENIPDQMNLTVEQNTMLKTSARNRMTWDDLMRPDSLPSAASNAAQCISANFPCISTALKWATLNRDMSFSSIAAADSRNKDDSKLRADESPDHVQVLVTGSLHLVGGVLELIYPNFNDAQ
ncbi:folylpolyglutamate synthase, mitochondrial-like [Pomacea canaliculata]|uniref:folylpolyglutamate synthase, mitochondrial-like n=1 Tax=Pomacea canaliculata TaxID=400727 RepID=UPI000D72A8B0|nr:folylpolyglutamate synthase, mitochondrial-like [Pomacea canaliculata]